MKKYLMDSIPSELLPNAKALYVQRCGRLVCLHGEMLEYRLITNVNWVLLESLCITGDMENVDIFLWVIGSGEGRRKKDWEMSSSLGTYCIPFKI